MIYVPEKKSRNPQLLIYLTDDLKARWDLMIDALNARLAPDEVKIRPTEIGRLLIREWLALTESEMLQRVNAGRRLKTVAPAAMPEAAEAAADDKSAGLEDERHKRQKRRVDRKAGG